MRATLTILAALFLASACSKTPPAAVTVADHMAGIAASAEQTQPLQAGTAAPAFSVRDASGNPWNFAAGERTQPALLIFFRGGWCPYCNTHLASLRQTEEQLRAAGVEVYFLSADRPELLYASLEEPDIGYTLLSDSRLGAARAFGIAFRVDDATVTRYKEYNIDLVAASGETHLSLPVPAVFLVDRTGIIRFSHANPDYKVRISADDLMTAVQEATQ